MKLKKTWITWPCLATSAFIIGCTDTPDAQHDEDVLVTYTQEITKAQDPNANGDRDFCNDPAALCNAGEGDCDTDSQCAGALVCGVNNGPKFGMPTRWDVCEGAHCNDGVTNGDEAGVDCGGSCAPCPAANSGDKDFCNSTSCVSGEGDCDSDAQCAGALVCGSNNGPKFNLPAKWDVCVPAHCLDGVNSGDETGTDCGGSCGTCPATGNNGDAEYCSNGALCSAGEGDCDSDAECAGALVCGNNNGAKFGLPTRWDVCVPAHCTDGAQSGDETGVDCGGSCGMCAL